MIYITIVLLGFVLGFDKLILQVFIGWMKSPIDRLDIFSFFPSSLLLEFVFTRRTQEGRFLVDCIRWRQQIINDFFNGWAHIICGWELSLCFLILRVFLYDPTPIFIYIYIYICIYLYTYENENRTWKLANGTNFKQLPVKMNYENQYCYK